MYFKKEFTYTGYVQNFTVLKTGIYLLEAWGAQGGNTTSSYWHQGFTGGYGAYAIGSVFLEKGKVVHVAVGQAGQVTEGISTFNGGGAAHQSTSCYVTASSGGGATHFSYRNRTLKELVNAKGSVLLVAAGGGGSFTSMCNIQSDSGSLHGGHAGGMEGSSPTYVYSVGWSSTIPTGGTQTRGGITSTAWQSTGTDSTTALYNGYFGQGGIYTGVPYSGGGGGWFGGASGNWRAGAGGSSYIADFLNDFGPNRKRLVCYNCKTSTNRTEYTISTLLCSYSPLRDTAKLGHGYAKVTLLESIFSCKVGRKNLIVSSYFFTILVLST